MTPPTYSSFGAVLNTSALLATSWQLLSLFVIQPSCKHHRRWSYLLPWKSSHHLIHSEQLTYHASSAGSIQLVSLLLHHERSRFAHHVLIPDALFAICKHHAQPQSSNSRALAEPHSNHGRLSLAQLLCQVTPQSMHWPHANNSLESRNHPGFLHTWRVISYASPPLVLLL